MAMKVFRGQKTTVAVTGIVALLGFGSSAYAENCVSAGGANVLNFTAGLPSLAASTANSITSAITSANSVFLTQSAALTGVPANAREGEIGGGRWARAVVGEVDTKSRSTSNVSATADGFGSIGISSGVVSCDSKVHANYQGLQVGSDIAKLSWGGFNIHVGITAGSLWSQNSVQGGPAVITAPGVNTAFGAGSFNSTIQVPFFGVYATINNSSGFFADFLARGQIFQNMLNSTALSLFNQQLGARGFSISASAGWNYAIPSTDWFVEPSAGIIVSRVSVDPLTATGTVAANVPGTLSVDQIRNTIGRAGVRVGTSFVWDRLVLQPFAAVSIWHDFVGSNSARFLTCPACVFTGLGTGFAAVQVDVRNENFGTFGQYSVGLSGALAGTGWLGFARVDYRDGSRLRGVNVTGGLRYQFTPEQLAMSAITKGPRVAVAPLLTWDGFYAGTYSAASLGQGTYDFGFGLKSEPRTSGFGSGGQIGYNYQTGPYVLGVEGEAGILDSRGSRACAAQGGNAFVAGGTVSIISPLFNQQCKARNPWTATVTGRAGYAFDKILFFARGGVAFTREIFEVKCNSAAPGIASQCSGVGGAISGASGFPGQQAPNFGFNTASSSVGYTVGGGFEFRINRMWSAKAEYAYMDFSKKTRTFSDGTVASVGTAMSQVKVGVNYHFSAFPDFW